jgi:hypothetical protein
MNVSEIESYIEKAKKYLKTANHLLEYGDYDSSVSRAYYSMYYSTRAILLSKDLTPKTHSGLLSLFGKYFIKSDILPKKLAKYLRKGFEARLLGDYNVSVRIQKENAQDLIKNTKRFNDAILDYLREKSII